MHPPPLPIVFAIALGVAVTALAGWLVSGVLNVALMSGLEWFAVIAALCVLQLAAAIGLWRLRRWGLIAQIGATIIAALEIALHLSPLFWRAPIWFDWVAYRAPFARVLLPWGGWIAFVAILACTVTQWRHMTWRGASVSAAETFT